MSTQKKKIGYWGFDFQIGDQPWFDPEVFCRFMDYLKTIDPQELLHRSEQENKAVALESIQEIERHGIRIYKVVFKSCKYNHSPDYMSSVDGTERPTAKLLSEGDKEITHFCFRVDDKEAYTIIESRRNGVSASRAVGYLNYHLKDFIRESKGLDEKLCIAASIIPPENFLDALKKTSKISSAELFVERKVIGTGYLELMDEDINSQEDLIITVKAKSRQSLGRRGIEQAFTALTTGGTRVSRIRLRGKDADKMDVTLDTLKGKKVTEVNVELLESGIVNSRSMFSEMEKLLGV